MHPEARLEGESLDFRRKARVSRRAGVIDGRRLTIRLRSEEDECRCQQEGIVFSQRKSLAVRNSKTFFPIP